MAMNPRLLVPRATGFNPKSISGLNLWIDFSDTSTVTLDGSNKIQDVLDKSGLGQHGTQATSANRLAVSTLNGRQCADNGTSSNQFRIAYALGSNGNNWRDGYVAAVWDAGGSTFPGFNSFFSASASTGTLSGAFAVGNSGGNTLDGGANWYASTARAQLNNTVSVNASPALVMFPDITSPFVFRGSPNADIGVNGWQIGSDRALSARGWRGRIGEVICFSRRLTDAEALRVRRYLAQKWGAPAQT